MHNLLLIIILIFTYSCSIERNSNFWEKKDNVMVTNLEDLNLDQNLAFDKFKKNIIIYGKQSKFPKLNIK
tara:strand:+ start:323 stop:532 length:210 start_codon:yes stop_codon:yes gene_type:complete